MSKYITIFNKRTGKCIPFLFMENGEIQIASPDPIDDEDNCIILTGDTYYEYSHDLLPTKKL